MTVPGHTSDFDLLRAKGTFDVGLGNAGILSYSHVFLQLFDQGREVAVTFLGWINRNTDTHISGWLDCSQRDQQIIQPHDRPARCHPNHDGIVIDDPTFGRTAKQDVIVGLIDHHPFDALQPTQKLYFVRKHVQVIRQRVFNRGVQATQRNHAQIHRTIQFAYWRRNFLTQICQQHFAVFNVRFPQDARRVDRDPPNRIIAEQAAPREGHRNGRYHKRGSAQSPQDLLACAWRTTAT